MNPKDINFKSQDKGYMYTITPWISIDILNDKLRLQNLHYKIWKGE